MAVRIVRLGAARAAGEGLRLGTVRRPPRGVRKTEYATRDFFDVWLPELAPSDAVFAFARAKPWTGARWKTFSRKYAAEMARAVPSRLLGLLAALSQQADFSVGCYCEDEARCHRSLLAGLLRKHGAKLR